MLDYGYDMNDFLNSFNTNNIDNHTPYGVKNFIDERRNMTVSQLEFYDLVPVIRDEHHLPLLPDVADPIDITVTAIDGRKSYEC
jgi:hypothetical protein